MKRTIPLMITFFTGLFFMVQFFVPRLDELSNDLQASAIVIGTFALYLAVGNLARVHLMRINRKQSDWELSAVMLTLLVFTAVIGLYDKADTKTETNIAFIYKYVYSPLGATMFSTLAFYIASAAFRAFRIKTFEASLLMISGFLVMLGRVPLGAAIWDQ
ncbi:MAG: hypothetical protein PHQ23_05010, partial [Candidatus Wallbacteria bacterium]|nr:hypothetical protein [Candidatus Wallbacteria bacterium]